MPGGFTAPGDLAAGISLDGTGVSVRLGGASSGKRGRVVRDKVFYPNVGVDTDYFVAPAAAGFETFSVLRSIDSPEKQTFDIDLPAGAELRLTQPEPPLAGAPVLPAGGRGAEVVRDGERIATVSSPRAVDADGQPVEVSLEVDGSRLSLVVPHRDEDVAYPLLVDPVYENFLYWIHNSGLDRNGWEPADGAGGNWVNYFGNFWGDNGFYTYSNGGWYSPGNWGEWHFVAPRASYIYRVEFGHVNHSADGSCNHLGTWPSVQYSARIRCDSFWNYDFYTHCPDGTCSWDPGAGWAPDGNRAIFKEQIEYWNGYHNNASSYMGSAYLYEYDRNDPYISYMSPDTTNWVHDIPAGQYNGVNETHVRGNDAGLGIAKLWLDVPGRARQERVFPCATSPDPGDRNHRCGESDAWTFSYAGIPEGRQTVTAWAVDIIDRKAITQRTFKIDRSPPDAPAISGPLWARRNQEADHRNEGLYDGSYTLDVSGRDGLSGLKTIEIQVDNNLPYKYTARCAGTDSCSDAVPTWTFNSGDYSDGEHTIRVSAKDAVADQPGIDISLHTTTRSFQVTVDRRGDIYRSRLVQGTPTVEGATTASEWVRYGTRTARRVDPEVITTRTTVACDERTPSGPKCGEVRERSRLSEANAADSDAWTVYRSVDPEDGKLPQIAETLDGQSFMTSSAAETGPLNAALAVWQRPPPAHGATYERHRLQQQTDTSQPGDDATGNEPAGGTTETVTVDIWIDATTRMLLRSKASTSTGADWGTIYYTYDVGRLEGAAVPAEFFRVARPANVGQETSFDYRGTASIGEQTDSETGARFTPYAFGPGFTTGAVGTLCLGRSLIMRLTEYEAPTIFDPTATTADGIGAEEAAARVPDPVGPLTTPRATYYPVRPGETCVAGRNAEGDPALEIRSAAPGGSTAAAWRNGFERAGAEIVADPLYEDVFGSGPQPIFFGAEVTTAYVLPLDGDGTHAALLQRPDASIVITGRFDKTTLQQLVGELRPQ